MINLELKKGMYIRFKDKRGIQYIRKITSVNTEEPERRYAAIYIDKDANNCNGVSLKNIIGEPSFNIVDLIEYMDLLEIENPIKLYGENKTVALFNPVRCDGFTEFEDGTHCIILNLDYLVDVKDLKIKSVLTKEQFEAMKYVVERDK